ncbi:MAG TPA: nitroreductase family protein [Selenomonadales bacterium]|nr:nitroreductase family protein [Selenomonadales bacterium]
MLEAILTRRSVRNFARREVGGETVEELLKAAMSAPSAGNEQPWEFVVLRDRPTLDRIADVHAYGQMLRHCPVAILVCGDFNRQKYEGFWIQDCAAATENLLIAANALGLGAVWLGVYPIEERVTAIRGIVAAPEEIVPFSLVAVGHPVQAPPPAERFDRTRIHNDRW